MKKSDIDAFIEDVDGLVYSEDFIQKIDVTSIKNKLHKLHVKKSDINKIIDIVDNEIYEKNNLSKKTENELIKILQKY